MLPQNCRQVAAPCTESTNFILLTFFEIPSTAQVFCRIFSTKMHAEVGGCQLKSLGLIRRSACMAHIIHPLPYVYVYFFGGWPIALFPCQLETLAYCKYVSTALCNVIYMSNH